MSRRRVFRSTRCAAFGHPEFEVTIDSTIPDGDAQWLLGVLEKSVGEGRQFEDEETIEIGAAFLKAKVKDERLAIFEPHFRGMPMEWVEGVTQSLRNVRMQRDVAESVGLLEEHDQPSILKPLMIGTDVNETTATLF